MHPFAGTPFAFWMTSYMCWANMVAPVTKSRYAKKD